MLFAAFGPAIFPCGNTKLNVPCTLCAQEQGRSSRRPCGPQLNSGVEPTVKKSTMDTYWVPGVNHTAQYGRWAFAEFTEVYQIEADFKAKVESEFNKMIEGIVEG